MSIDGWLYSMLKMPIKDDKRLNMETKDRSLRTYFVEAKTITKEKTISNSLGMKP